MSDADHRLPVGAAFLIEAVTQREPFTYEDFGSDELGLASTADDFVRKEVLPHLEEIENKKDGLMPAREPTTPRCKELRRA